MKKIMTAFCLMLMFCVPCFCHTIDTPFVQTVNAANFEITTDPSGGITIKNPKVPNMNSTDLTELAKAPLDKYKKVAVIVTGFATVTAFLAMIFCITKLSTAGDNEQARHRAITGILTSGVAVALLGGATVIIGFFWNLLL